MQPPLQCLRIPTGWHVNYNEFREADPSGDRDDLKEDLFQAYHAGANRLLDLGRYPDGDAGAPFALKSILATSAASGPFVSNADDGWIISELERLLASIAESEF